MEEGMKLFEYIRLLGFALIAGIVVFASSQTVIGANGKNIDGEADKKVAFLITEGFHDAETLFPKAYLTNHGIQVTLIGAETGTFTAYNSDVNLVVEKSIADVSIDSYDALVIPGGHSPGNLREHESAVDFAREFVERNKPTAAICHGPQVLVTADVINGRNLTGVEGIEDEITGAGAQFSDQEVLVDDNLITSRVPDDLPAFSRAILNALSD